MLIRAAHYLHTPPWELAEKPSAWLHWALAVMDGEAQVEAKQMRAMFGGKGK